MSDSVTERVLARYMLEPKTRSKTAAFPPFPPQGEEQGTSDVRRNIPKDHDFQARALKPLSKALWASTVALGHALTAYRHLSRLKSATVSPDGLMGGRGYVMKLSEMRQKLYEASEALSTISDTIFDEINAPHWKPKLAQLDDSDKEDVTRFIEEAQEVMENPEGEAEDEIEEIESRDEKRDSGAEDDSSSLPGGGDTHQAESAVQQAPRPKEASLKRPCGMSERGWIYYFYAETARREGRYPEPLDPSQYAQQAIYSKCANSSQPVSELPGGPRVDHLGPGNGQGEYGDFSEAETLSPPPDEWSADGGGISRRDNEGEDYDYSSEWENNLSRSAAFNAPTAPEIEEWWEYMSPHQIQSLARSLKLTSPNIQRWNAHDWEKAMDHYVRTENGDSRGYQRPRTMANSNVPDAVSDDTPTDANDFGIGYGARGEGTGGYANPSGEGFAEGPGGKGVWGPHSGLPGTPPQSTGDTTHLVLDEATNRHAARAALYGELPQDVAGDVARSDYYPGAKDNEVTVGTSGIPTPDDSKSDDGQRLLNTYYTNEDRQTDYERYDFTTHTIRSPGGAFPGQDHQEPFAPDGEATR